MPKHKHLTPTSYPIGDSLASGDSPRKACANPFQFFLSSTTDCKVRDRKGDCRVEAER
jgi:hypothetical protein